MRIQDLCRLRELVLVEYLAGRFSMETAQAKCRVITRAIETMAEMNLQRYQEEAKRGRSGGAMTPRPPRA